MKIIVRGPALSNSGYGEHCRALLRALKDTEYEVGLINVGWGSSGWITEDSKEREEIDSLIMETAKSVRSGETDYDMSFQVQLPSEWQSLAPVNIGVTAGSESTSVSEDWNDAASAIDAVIVPTNHAKNSFSEAVRDKIHVVPYCVRDVEPDNTDFGLPKKFNFLTVAQWGPRKNIEQTIASFIEEFRDDDVGLVLKLGLKSGSKIDREYIAGNLARFLQGFPSRTCGVYLLHGTLTEAQMRGLYTNESIGAYISTSHGEGFGLPIFEAAQEGLPVISPMYSGVCDFLEEEYITPISFSMEKVGEKSLGVISPESSWCKCDGESVRKAMREVYTSHSEAKDKAKILAHNIKKNNSEQNINKMYNSIISMFLKKGENNETK